MMANYFILFAVFSIISALTLHRLAVGELYTVSGLRCGVNVQMTAAKKQSNSSTADYLMRYVSNVGCNENAKELEFPWQVRLQIFGNEGYYYACGGTVIDRSWVLTSAKCARLANRPNQIVAVFGLHNVTKPTRREFAITASKIFIHPRHKPSIFNFDFALLKMGVPIDFAYVQPICLPKSCNTEDSCQPGDLAIATGWGISEGIEVKMLSIRKEVVQLASDIACLFAYPFNRAMVTHEKWCVGSPINSRPTCAGDDGGPLVCVRKNDETYQFQLIGVTNHAYHVSCPQHKRTLYQGFGRVCSVVRWIQAIIERDPGDDYP